MHKDINKNMIYDLTNEDKDAICEHKKFYRDFFKFGNILLEKGFTDTVEDYELTVYSAYYRLLEILDTLEVMTEHSLINSALLVVRSLLEGAALLCYVLYDEHEIEKRAIVWQMMDIKRTANDEKVFFRCMRNVECYKKYIDIIQNAPKKWPNWYSYCENRSMNIQDVFVMAGLQDLYNHLYSPLCYESHQVNHMETNIDIKGGKFRFKPFRFFGNHFLLLNCVIRIMLPVNKKMIERYGTDALKSEWAVYQNKGEEYIKNNNLSADLMKWFGSVEKWF